MNIKDCLIFEDEKIQKISHDKNKNILRFYFNNSEYYELLNVPRSVFEGLKKSKNIYSDIIQLSDYFPCIPRNPF